MARPIADRLEEWIEAFNQSGFEAYFDSEALEALALHFLRMADWRIRLRRSTSC